MAKRMQEQKRRRKKCGKIKADGDERGLNLMYCRKSNLCAHKLQKGEERNVAKSKSAAMNLSSHVPTSSSPTKSLIASKSPVILTATEKPESKMRRNSKSDAASSCQARLEDAYLGGLMDIATEKLVASEEESGIWTIAI